MFRVAVVGRPNVGKSTLFNRLCGKRKAIVGNESGITRDRIYGVLHWCGAAIEIIDTGGMIPNTAEIIPAKVLEQVEAAIRESDLLLFVVDGRVGATPLDEQLLPILRRSALPVWVVVNKLDTPELEAQAAPFYSFGFEHVFPVSAEHSLGIAELLDAVRRFPLKHRQRVTFEYVLLKDVTDSPQDARALVKLLKGIPAKVNLIPLNEAEELDYSRPSDESVERFRKILVDHQIDAFVRKNRGNDISAACGQLKKKWAS